MTRFPRAWRLAVFGLLFVLSAAISACGGGGGSSTSTPIPDDVEPALVDVPAGTRIDFERAAQLYRERDYDAALVIYSAAAKNGTPEQKQAGLLATARIQNETGMHDEAARTAQAFRRTGPTADQDRQALLILGSSLFARGDLELARAPLEEYVSLGGPASGYAQMYLAQVDSGEGKLGSAAERLNDALDSGLPASSEYDAYLLLAGVEVQRENDDTAVDAYRAAADAAPTATKAAEALWLLAENAGDDEIGEDALATLVANYPITDRALEALDDPRVVNNPQISDIARGTVYLNHRENEKATEAFESIVAADAQPAAVALAEYNLGILSERAEEWDAAIQHYDNSIATVGEGLEDQRAQSSWDKGTVLELQGLTSDAIEAYAAVSDYSPTATRAAEGVFRAGYLAFILGRPADAAAYWTRYKDVAIASEDIARADYWLAEAAFANGDEDSFNAYLSEAAADDQLDYFGMRAAARIAGETALPEALDITPPTPDWNRYEVWLAGWAGPEDVATTAIRDELFASDAWLGAVDLFEAGLTNQADSQFSALLADNATDAWLTYRLIRAISDYHRPWLTSPAAAGLLGEPDAPPEALQLMYPLEYWDLVQEEASANGYSPLLLLALIRQESLYDPSAVSVANALGLTQVVPSTAEGIAEELGFDDFKESDLLVASTSIKFGAYYLGQALDGFGGALPPTVAGYNAGPGTSGAWWEEAGLDPDLFLESVPYAETRLFVEVVLENYARYLYAYGVTDAPSLPLS
jgi:soluble lytic murein transglycosylase